MSNIDLTDEIMAPAEAVVIEHGRLVEGDAIDLAWDTVRAALPLIEAAVREQITRDIEAEAAVRRANADDIAAARGGVRDVHSDALRMGVGYAARIARGEQS